MGRGQPAEFNKKFQGAARGLSTDLLSPCVLLLCIVSGVIDEIFPENSPGHHILCWEALCIAIYCYLPQR